MLQDLEQRRQSSRPIVVLVDDDRGVRRSVGMTLQTGGYQVREYASGQELLADPAAMGCDCALVDYIMPGMDGLELIARMRATGWSGSAILITGRYDATLKSRAAVAGISTVLEKPLDKQTIRKAVADTL